MLYAHTVYLNDDELALVRSGEIKRKHAVRILALGLPEEIVVTEGTVVEYADGRANRYRIARVHGDDIVVERLRANKAGPAGQTHTTTLSKYVEDIQLGRAVIVTEEDA